MNMEHGNPSKSFQQGMWDKKAINGREEPNWNTIYVHMEMSQGNKSPI
jgi:hypothetical protein